MVFREVLGAKRDDACRLGDREVIQHAVQYMVVCARSSPVTDTGLSVPVSCALAIGAYRSLPLLRVLDE